MDKKALSDRSKAIPVLVSRWAPRDGRVARTPLLDQVQLIASEILRLGRVRGTAEETGEVCNGSEVGSLGFGRKLAQRHVLDHALTHGLMGLVD